MNTSMNTSAGVHFSVNGTRWHAVPISGEARPREIGATLPGAGILFTSAEGETRFLALPTDAVPSTAFLKEKTVAELATLVKLARSLAR